MSTGLKYPVVLCASWVVVWANFIDGRCVFEPGLVWGMGSGVREWLACGRVRVRVGTSVRVK